MVLSLLHRFRARPKSAPRCEAAPPRPALVPGEALCVIGDVHGAAALLERLLAQRAAHFPHTRVVFLGDMIDRGAESAAVVARVQAEVAGGGVALLGNHEAMCLDFLDAPTRAHPWLRHGGVETLISFGLDPFGTEALTLRDAFRDRLGAAEAWLRGCPLSWRSGNLVAAHAGLDPYADIAAQEPSALLWGHPDFLRVPRRDDLWVAHGHYRSARAFVRGARISLDSGAYASGRLSFAVIDPAVPAAERVLICAVV